MLHVLSRFLQMLVIIAFLSVALFGLLSAMPGNPVDMLITSNPNVKPEDVIRLKKLRGLDKPWYVQYVRWIWGYHEPHRPAQVDFMESITVKLNDDNEAFVKINLDNRLRDPDFRFSKEQLWAEIENNKPLLAKEIKNDRYIKNATKGQVVDKILEKVAIKDGDFYVKLSTILREKAEKSLKIVGLFGSRANGLVVSNTFTKDGLQPMWFIVKDSKGLETVSSILVDVLPKNNVAKTTEDYFYVDSIKSQVVDDPKTFKVALSDFIIKSKNQKIVSYELDKNSPGVIDENGIYRHIFKEPGQTAISFWAVNENGENAKGAFSVEHEPIANKDVFNRGFLFFFAGDKGALGFSTTYKRPVWELLSGRVSNTFSLMFPAILLSLLIAIPLGVLSAYKQYSLVDYSTNFFAFIGISLPVFWFGIMVMYVFAEKLQWFPAGGIQTPGISDEGFSAIFSDRIAHSVLPVVVLSIAYIGRWLRYMRASMLEILPSDYIRTARAKGLSEKTVILKHALRNALIPVVTVLALSIPTLFGGAVLTETVFAWPGIGRLQYDAVMNSDYYVAIVVFLISALLVMFGNLLADLLYVIVDPRIRNE
ncbi:ABC transporter permease subunit [Sulfobacillus acidophilus]|uniref:ABC transporter permease subunit n=1 Tax=Sulfobacillus acidophilus TaxID=53633 RepID=A0ABS3AV85_9FIRM|nr:ABC transporter permease subunit [Sulfobacillus acidophilus]